MTDLSPGRTTPDLFAPLSLSRGPDMKNRLMLAPMINQQSHPDGRLADTELNWLEMRAKGGFGLVMTCATSVQANGFGFPGQLGIFSDDHVPGLTRLATALNAHDTHSVLQLYHGGMRCPPELVNNDLVAPSADERSGARAMTTDEVKQLADDFIAGAKRADQAGFDGVEIHGAHGYQICAFLSPTLNRREDAYGGDLDGRSRLLFDIVDGVRAACRPDFSIGVRLSPERFGQRLGEIRQVAQRLMTEQKIDYIDMSLWDVFKEPVEDEFKGRPLVDWFTELDRGPVRLGGAGKLAGGDDARRALAAGLDFAVIGRAAILHHDFPQAIAADPDFTALPLPVSVDHLRSQGVGDAFLRYLGEWDGFLKESA